MPFSLQTEDLSQNPAAGFARTETVRKSLPALTTSCGKLFGPRTCCVSGRVVSHHCASFHCLQRRWSTAKKRWLMPKELLCACRAQPSLNLHKQPALGAPNAKLIIRMGLPMTLESAQRAGVQMMNASSVSGAGQVAGLSHASPSGAMILQAWEHTVGLFSKVKLAGNGMEITCLGFVLLSATWLIQMLVRRCRSCCFCIASTHCLNCLPPKGYDLLATRGRASACQLLLTSFGTCFSLRNNGPFICYELYDPSCAEQFCPLSNTILSPEPVSKKKRTRALRQLSNLQQLKHPG